ncbi:MAG: hypothetical protein LAP40_22270 [Acidobacteriia bacterium]|nr:hypothetical protein [Terriglobia bacterium]
MPKTEFFEERVLLEELEAIRHRREGVGFPPTFSVASASTNATVPAGCLSPEERVDRSTLNHQTAHQAGLFGLAFSGGGIRSATLNLGILQGLAELGLLPLIDYLSTVSGGGYIGSWLHGIIRNQHQGDPRKAAQALSSKANPIPESPDCDPISFLRKYSNYLAPSPGFFSADTWVIAAIWIRNVLLNQLILVPALAAVIVSALLTGVLSQLNLFGSGINIWSLVAASLVLFAAVVLMAGNLDEMVLQMFPREEFHATHWWEIPVTLWVKAVKGRNHLANRLNLLTIPLVFLAALLLGCTGLDGRRPATRFLLGVALLWLFWIFQKTGGFYRCYEQRHGSKAGAFLHSLWMVPICAALAEVLIIWVLARTSGSHDAWRKIAFAPPLISLSLIAGTGLLIGLMGVDYPDAAREWLARMGTMVALLCAAWAGLYGIAVFGPEGVIWLLAHYGKTGISAIGAWAAATATGVLAGKSAKTDGESNQSLLSRLLPIAPAIFMVGYLLAISLGVHLAIPDRPDIGFIREHRARAAATPPTTKYDITVHEAAGDSQLQVAVTQPTKTGDLTGRLLQLEAEYYFVLDFSHRYTQTTDASGRETADPRILFLVLTLAGSIMVTLVAAWRFNINEFSMHHFYKNRLVRCYLGASNNKDRRPNRFTGFDPNDDFALSSLLPNSDSRDRNYRGPFPIVNTALNLNTGSELARQERKATSFVFTPLYSGFDPAVTEEDHRQKRNAKGFDLAGYCGTPGYAYPKGPDLGTVTAISGAAANPNSGFHTSGPLAFLLTVFDARLGWWLANPRWSDVRALPGPRFALRYLFAELFGQTTGRSKFVNLSDGGHFDNLGLYELVRRRCRYIIVGDGEQDGDLTFGSLGQAIRMCRADFGVEIEISPDPIRIGANSFSKTHCVVGKIHYPEQEPGHPGRNAGGWLLYLKSSLTGNEPADVIEYHSRFHEFPHQSTADQFFTESQFESYRRLGLHIANDAFEGAPRPTGPAGMEDVFQYLEGRWYAPIPVPDEAASRLANAYSDLIKAFAGNPNLYYLAEAVAPEMSVTPGAFNDECFGFGVQLIQLMENVFTEFKLGEAANRNNPRIDGWMRVFTRWCRSASLYGVWVKVRDDYNRLFQKFVEDLHGS